MSPNSRAPASTSTALDCGCGAEAAGAEAMRLSEKDCATNCACGVPSAAKYCAFFAMSWMVLPTLRKTASRAPPIWLE